MVRLRYSVILLVLVLIYFVVAKECDPNKLRQVQCSENESCSPKGVCDCREGFARIDKICQNVTKPSVLPIYHVTTTMSPSARVAQTTGNHVIVGIAIPLLIVIVICGVFVNRRYRVVDWVRNKIHQRNTTYDEVMIGQDLDDDDPPLR